MSRRIALVRRPSGRIADGIVTYGERAPVDPGRAAEQHAAYGALVAADTSLPDSAPLPPLRRVPEEAGSHVVPLGGPACLVAASAPRSAELFRDWGFDPVVVEIGEFEKMEGCVTCLSVLM